jgi:hypothetical protein
MFYRSDKLPGEDNRESKNKITFEKKEPQCSQNYMGRSFLRLGIFGSLVFVVVQVKR